MTDWKWEIMEDMPCPPERFLNDGVVIKKGPCRTVTKKEAPDGTFFFVKRDHARGFKAMLRELFTPKNLAELRTSEYLARKNIPALKYAAYGRKFPESILISRELEGYIPATEFMHTVRPLPECFLASLLSLVRSMLKEKILHPDFHAGNLMVCKSEPSRIMLIDLYGIRQVRYTPFEADCHIFTDFMDFLPDGKGEELLRSAGADPALWQKMIQKTMAKHRKNWHKRVRQIMSGDSKFARKQIIDGTEYQVRTTPWFQIQSFSPGEMDSAEMPEAEALEKWIEMFRCEMFRETFPGRKMEALRLNGDKTAVYYRKEKNTL